MSEPRPVQSDHLDKPPESAISQGNMLWNKTGAWRYLRPVYRRHTPACNNGCPAGIDIEGFVRLAGENRFQDALKLIKNENPFPGVCGRVCFHPCETACNRNAYDHPIAIAGIERFIFEEASGKFKPEKLCADSPGTVAVVGTGPASLTCAYHLARMGHPVTLFEAADKPGGILRYGIPPSRLPERILDREINDIISLGVTIKCNTRIGRDISWDDLNRYDAVFIGTGSHKHRPLFEAHEGTKGFYPSLKYLTLAAKNETKDFGKNTAVIGGGQSAIDAARTALRLGSKVTVYYHLTRENMPAFEEDISDAEKEGVIFEFFVQPIDMIIKWGRIKGLGLRKTRLAIPDASGRRHPEPVPGSSFTIRADTIIAAIGETPDFDLLPDGLKHDGKKLTIDAFGRTSHENIFAGGDVALEHHNIAQAIGSGKASACAMDAFLCGGSIDDVAPDIRIGNTQQVSVMKYLATKGLVSVPLVSQKVVDFKDLNTAYFFRKARSKKEKLDISKRLEGFEEVCKTFSVNAVLAETDRCFHCGVCNMCDNCLKFCPDVSVIKRKDNTGYDIDLDYCKGCGICVNECPRAAMAMEEDK